MKKFLLMIFFTLIFNTMGNNTSEAAVTDPIPRISKDKIAIVMVEFQNIWLDSNGDLNSLIKNQHRFIIQMYRTIHEQRH